MRIGQKLILGFLVVSLVPLIILSFISIQQQANILEKYAITDAEDVARTIEESISLEPQTLPIYLVPEDLQELLTDFIEAEADFVVVDVNKKILADAITKNIGTEFTHDTGNEVGLAIKTGVAQTFIEKSPDYPEGINLVAVPMRSEDEEEVVGAVLMEYKEGKLETAQASARSFGIAIIHQPIPIPLYSEKEKLQGYVTNLSKDMGRDIVVMDLNKIILADTVLENIGTEFTHDKEDEIRQTMKDGKTRTFKEISVDYPQGVSLIVVPLSEEIGEVEKMEPIIGAVVTSYIPLFQKSLQLFRIIIAAILIVGVIIVLVISIFISRSISVPITKLRDVAIDIGKGGLNKRAEVKSKDEIGELATSFNQMTDEIQKRNEELQTMNEELRSTNEELQSTTEELEASNEELRKTQEELIQKEKLAAVGQLASGVGHELRNPLGVIKNAVYYIKSKIGMEDPKLAKHIGIMEKEIANSNKIISDLLGFSRTRPPAIVPSDMNKVVEDTLEVVEIPENMKLVKELGADLPHAMADPDQIQQVFVNLSLNAIQAMLEGGQLKIATRKKDDFIEVEFRDTGCGIPEENIEKLYDPFFTTKARGIGLGLAVSQGIIERHKGSIEVKSEVGKGTIFVVKLPVEKKEG